MLLVIISLVFGGQEGNIWDAFVSEPNEANYKICQKQIKDSLSGNYRILKSPTYIQLTKNNIIREISYI